MATLLKPPQRYTHPEWSHSNKTKYKNAEKERAASERLVEESKRLVVETQDRADTAQADVNKKLGMYRIDYAAKEKSRLTQKSGYHCVLDMKMFFPYMTHHVLCYRAKVG